ncbi:MAG: hypothetical protein KTR29_00920 [Rhodothermaceae bacterium]|nr:hypothetical protein [Rhodothermaceae bacterium]
MTKLIKRALFAWLFIGVSLVSTSFAQGFGSPEQRAERAKAQVEEIVGKLDLQDDQAKQVRDILMAQSEEQVSIFEAYAGQRDRNARGMMRQEMQDLQAMTTEKLSTVLSEDKLKVYKETVAEIQERRRGQAGGRRGGNRSPN